MPDSEFAHSLIPFFGTPMDLNSYQIDGFFDEMFEEPGKARDAPAPLASRLANLPVEELLNRQRAAEAAMMRMGITFNPVDSIEKDTEASV